jgi:hypothetical protein
LFRAQSATPINITYSNDDFGAIIGGFRPDLVAGVPLYIEDSSLPGGRRFNNIPSATDPRQFGAFRIPTTLRQGTLGRNALRGFPFNQLDLGITRRFSLTEKAKLQFRSEFFNILNHPNFANPSGFLAETLGTDIFPAGNDFGIPTQMFGRGLGGVNPIFQVGGPRSIQFALRLEF